MLNKIIGYICKIMIGGSLISSLVFSALVYAANTPSDIKSSSLKWMDSYPDASSAGGGNCIDPPEGYDSRTSLGFTSGNIVIDTQEFSQQWNNTDVGVEQGKKVELKIASVQKKGERVMEDPDRYLVLYRINPTFPKTGQAFVIRYDKASNKFISNFHDYKNGKLIKYQAEPEENFGMEDKLNDHFVEVMKDYEEFFSSDYAKIPVKAGDIVDISIVSPNDFFTTLQTYNGATASEFVKDLEVPTDENLIDTYKIYTGSGYLKTPEINNAIIKFISKDWHYTTFVNFGIADDGTYRNVMKENNICEPPLTQKKFEGLDILVCHKSDSGLGMQINLNGQVIKDLDKEFLLLDDKEIEKRIISPKSVYYFKSNTDGKIDFFSDISFLTNLYIGDDEYKGIDTLIKKCGSAELSQKKCSRKSYNTGKSYIIGRYFLYVTVGKEQDASNGVKSGYEDDLEYIISDQEPNASTQGTKLSESGAEFNASMNGKIWVRAINKKSEQKLINLKYQVFTGNNVISNFLFEQIFQPVTKSINDISKLFFVKIVADVSFHRVVIILLTLYIIFYGLYFLAGATQITTGDLLSRSIKITIVAALFSSDSWNFFNNNLFVFFSKGMLQLLNSAIGDSSSVDNPFGFIDPIFARYMDWRYWAIVLIMLVQLPSGLFIFGIIMIISTLYLFRTLLEVFIGTIMSMIGIAVLICLAPIFITFMLFSMTRSIFERWLVSMLAYSIYPLLLFVFVLILEQLMSFPLSAALPKVCWAKLFDLNITLDLSHLGLSKIRMQLPFFSSFYFFKPVTDSNSNLFTVMSVGSLGGLVAGGLLLWSYSVMAYRLLQYAQTLIGALTSTNLGQSTMVQSITNDGVGSLAQGAMQTKQLVNAASSGMQSIGGTKSQNNNTVEENSTETQSEQESGVRRRNISQ